MRATRPALTITVNFHHPNVKSEEVQITDKIINFTDIICHPEFSEVGSSFIDWAQQSGFLASGRWSTASETSFQIKIRMMYNVQKMYHRSYKLYINMLLGFYLFIYYYYN